MQDRFKFRIWNKVSKQFASIGINTALTVNNISEDFLVQQCIGVKDKLGRLVYEGDVVKYTEDEVDEDDYTLVMLSSSIGKVTYSENASFTIETIHIGNYYQYWDEIDEGERTLDFYSCDGQEFSWERLEVIASIADNNLLDLKGNVISTLTSTEDTFKLLGVYV